MEENKNEILDKLPIGGVQDSEIFELGYLVNVILDYYTSTGEASTEGEEWKKGTEYEREAIPQKIDKLVQQAFEVQLKKFIR